MNTIYRTVALLAGLVLAALFAASVARAGLSSANDTRAVPTALASAIGPALASDARELAPGAVNLGLAVAPSDQQAIAALVAQHNALHALLGVTVAPSHPAAIAALVQQEALREQLAVEVASSHAAEIDALLRGYQATE